MTREEAISLLRRYRRDVYGYNPRFIHFTRKDVVFRTCVYGQFLIDEIIHRIRTSSDDPIDIVARIYSQLDEVLGDSDDDHFLTHHFASMVECEARNILHYLRRVEKEKNEECPKSTGEALSKAAKAR